MREVGCGVIPLFCQSDHNLGINYFDFSDNKFPLSLFPRIRAVGTDLLNKVYCNTKMTDSSDVGDSAQVQVSLADMNNFLKYLRKVVPVCLEEDAPSSPALETALADKSHQEAVRRFISDSQTRAIFIQRSSTKGMYDCHSNPSISDGSLPSNCFICLNNVHTSHMSSVNFFR